jgi:4-amino-4-deoxy-L-arabinose transferase-like glycosyltransferase
MKPVLVKQLIIAFCGIILFVPFLGQVHLFDWDEANFAECAREMILTDNYLRVQVDFQPFWEKPPIFIWMQVLCMQVFGIGEFAARLPNALIGVATLCTLFHVGRRVVSERMAWWWVALYVASWLPHFYFKTGIIDPGFNLFIFCAFFQVWLIKSGRRKIGHALLAGVFLGLATLTKGPVAILISLLSLAVFLIINKGLWGYKWQYLLLVALSCFATTAIWFGVDIIKNGWWFTQEFIAYQIRLFGTEDAGHGGPFYYHFLVLLIGCFPASAFLLPSSRKSTTGFHDIDEKHFAQWMIVLLCVTLLLFSIVKTKIVHYSSLCYFPLTFLAARHLSRIDEGIVPLKKGIWTVLSIIGVMLGVAILLLPIVGMNLSAIIPYVKDEFAVANMQAAVSWSAWECVYGAIYLIGLCVALWWMRRQLRKGMILLVCIQILVIQSCALHFAPKVEAYSQRAAIEFYKTHLGEDAYVKPLGFKSYAYLFYTQSRPNKPQAYYDHGMEWLLKGAVDKPVYFVSKITSEKAIVQQYPQLVKVGARNGYVFWRRADAPH